MRQKIAKIFGFLCMLGIILMGASNLFVDEYHSIILWIGIAVLGISVIPYLCTSEKISELFYKLLDLLDLLGFL